MNSEILMKRYQIESAEKWKDVANTIPYLQFSKPYEFKVIPPFAGAMARFVVRNGDKSVSIYLDTCDRLGFFGAPYYEAYPIDGDTRRYGMEDPVELKQMIQDIENELK